jgi:putative membrane protein
MLKRAFGVAGILLLAVGCSQSTQELGGNPSPNLTMGDNEWFKTMAIANMTEIQSSQLALSKSQSPAVKDFAQKMIDDHTIASNELMQLAADKQVTLPTQLDSTHQAMLDDLKGRSGADFDKVYIDDQIKAHEDTLAEDEKEADNGTDAQAKMQANKLIDTLKMHLQMAEKLHNGDSNSMMKP